MSAARDAAWLRARLVGAYDDALTDYCTEIQTLVDRGEATAEQVTAVLEDAFPFSDEIQEAWAEWLEEEGVTS